MNFQRPYFSKQDISSIVEQCSGDKFKGVDILLTSEWPKGVDNFTKPPVHPV
jgi:hypothetical protein